MEEVERLKEILLEIVMHGGRVCPDFETCTHEACKSNVMMWMLAEAGVSGKTLAQVRHEESQAKLAAAGQALAVTIQCFKPSCAVVIVIPAPAQGEHPVCTKCGTKDVVVIDDDRCPDGTLNNCALAGGYDESICQMCNRGPCPEGAKFRSPGYVPGRYDLSSGDPFAGSLESEKTKKRRLR